MFVFLSPLVHYQQENIVAEFGLDDIHKECIEAKKKPAKAVESKKTK